ncbi:GNAT family N-acetyltransferase [Brevibacterium atlanticum]|uniref:GNAT family N-acetyltransferase n=1 Tax=Brevibacterium atlanticum TaxID=2697563 RepID=UPI00141E8DF9|nr:GNAT family N-acetyltransferase [Brevibacterium atlanticum]
MSTQRLRLEPLTPDHAEEMVETLSATELYEFIGGTPPTLPELQRLYSLQAAGRAPSGDAGWLNWIVRDKVKTNTVGYVQATLTTDEGRYQADIAWVIAPDRQRQGLATEAAVAMVEWLGERAVTDLRAAIHPGNVASNRVAERLGLHPSDDFDDGEIIWRTDDRT